MSVDMFLKVDGILGESRDHQHGEEMEIIEYGWGMTSPRDSFSGMASGAPRVDNLTLVKRVDKGTPKFIEALTRNKRLKEAVLSFRKAGLQAEGKPQMDFLVITLTDVFVVNWQPAGEDSEALLEKVTFNFRKFSTAYFGQKRDGTPEGKIEVTWDAAAHR
jgi:type VI secretion system secreted protein Hcp